MVGSPPSGSVIPVDARVLFSERRLLGCVGGSNVPARDIPRIVQLYRNGSLLLDELVSQRFAIADAADAFAAAAGRSGSPRRRGDGFAFGQFAVEQRALTSSAEPVRDRLSELHRRAARCCPLGPDAGVHESGDGPGVGADPAQ